MQVPCLLTTPQRNIVLAFKRGPALTHYVGLDGCTLSIQKSSNVEFDRDYSVWTRNTIEDFARKYLTPNRSVMIGLTGAAYRVLSSILSHSPPTLEDEVTTQPKELKMTEETFRKPDGPVAQIHAYLDKKREAIVAGTVSRKELIEQLTAKGFNGSTITTQCGVWGRDNGVTFARPAQAESVKAEAKAAARAAKKAATK